MNALTEDHWLRISVMTEMINSKINHHQTKMIML